MEQCSLVMDISGSDSVGSAGQNTIWRWRDKGEIERQIRLAKGMLCENRRRWLPEPLAPSLQTLALASQCSIRSCVRPWQTLDRQRQEIFGQRDEVGNGELLWS